MEITTNAQQIADTLLVFAETIREQLLPWDQLIVTDTEVELVKLYGDRLAALWQTEVVAADMGELGHVRTQTDSLFVLGFEFGVRPHEIWAHHIALRFEKNGELLYRRMVHHPGTKGKNLSGDLASEMEMNARSHWADGIATLLTNLQNEIP